MLAYVFVTMPACTLTCCIENMESVAEILKSIFAQLEYTYEVCSWHSQLKVFISNTICNPRDPSPYETDVHWARRRRPCFQGTCIYWSICYFQYITSTIMWLHVCLYAENLTAHSTSWLWCHSNGGALHAVCEPASFQHHPSAVLLGEVCTSTTITHSFW